MRPRTIVALVMTTFGVVAIGTSVISPAGPRAPTASGHHGRDWPAGPGTAKVDAAPGVASIDAADPGPDNAGLTPTPAPASAATTGTAPLAGPRAPTGTAPFAGPRAPTASGHHGPGYQGRGVAAARGGPDADLFRPGPMIVNPPGFLGWALLNRNTGVITGSANQAQTSTTASMIKAWLAADYLRIAAARGQTPRPAWLHLLSIAIRDSDNDAAQAIFVANGATASVNRLIRVCGLTDSAAVPDAWGWTRMSPRDAVRMGACLADGRAAGPRWTGWILNEMRHVRGVGRFGIIEALPSAAASRTAIKNGWLLRDEDGLWHLNCLAIVGSDWVLAVMMRYPGELGMAHGAQMCRAVTIQLLRDQP
jgi:hypothetical protein